MKTQDVINYFGGEKETETALGVSPTTIANWKAKGEISNPSQPMIEILTEGKLKWERPPMVAMAEKMRKEAKASKAKRAARGR